MLFEEHTGVFLTLLAIALTGFLTSIEYLYSLGKGGLGSASLFHWNVCRSRQGWPFRGRQAEINNWLFQPNIFVVLMTLRIIGCLILVTVNDRTILAIVILGLILSTGLLALRHVHGHDGADQMMMLLCVGMLTYFLFENNSSWRWAGILFIGGQAILAYFVSGAAKLISEEWRSGRALSSVLTTRIYGTLPVGKVMQKHPIVCMVLAWGLMIWEISSLFLILSSSPYVWIWLAIGVSFHLSAALLMGLNTFLLAFLGSYPAVLMTVGILQFP